MTPAKRETTFKWVQHTPVGILKDMSYLELETIQQDLILEVREASRALHWVDGIIRLKKREKSQTQNHAEA